MKKKLLTILLLFALLITNYNAVTIASTISIDSLVGDINGNNELDSQDIEILEEYIIGSRNTINEEQADLDGDKKITLIDLAILIKLVASDTNYDKYNATKISYYQDVPIVSSELKENEKVTTGGEGCQWPISNAMSSDGNILLYGTDVGGIYRSEDGGKNYGKADSGFGARGACGFAFDPINSNYVYAVGSSFGSYEKNGIYLSEDGGKTWKQVLSKAIRGYRDIREQIVVDASSYDETKGRCMTAYWSIGYIGDEQTSLPEEEAGLYRTTDGGETWELIHKTLCDSTLKIDPYTGNLYVAKQLILTKETEHYTERNQEHPSDDNGIYMSRDGGETFEKIVEDIYVLGFDLISNNQKITLYYNNKEASYISEDGRSFQKIESENFPMEATYLQNGIEKSDQIYARSIKVSPTNPNNMVLVTNGGVLKYNENNMQRVWWEIWVWYSHDGGKNWTPSTITRDLSIMPFSTRETIPIWNPVDENKIYMVLTGDYMSSSSDAGESFEWDSNGINGIKNGGNIHYNVHNPDLLYVTAQDYAGAVSTNGGKTWKVLNPTNNSWGGHCYGGYAVTEDMYITSVASDWYGNRELVITYDGGETFEYTGMYFNEIFNNCKTLESSYQSPTDENILFACDLRSVDFGHTWERMEGCLAVYDHNITGKKELYGMDPSRQYVVVSYDNGTTWNKVNKVAFNQFDHIEGLNITDLEYDYQNNKVYVAAGNEWDYGYLYSISIETGEISYVIRKGITSENTAPLNSKNDYIIKKVAVDNNDTDIVYCGGPGIYWTNESSLYRTVDGGKTFQVVTTNTTNSIVKEGRQGGFEVDSLEVDPKTGKLLIAGECFGISMLTPPYKFKEPEYKEEDFAIRFVPKERFEMHEIKRMKDKSMEKIIRE